MARLLENGSKRLLQDGTSFRLLESDTAAVVNAAVATRRRVKNRPTGQVQINRAHRIGRHIVLLYAGWTGNPKEVVTGTALTQTGSAGAAWRGGPEGPSMESTGTDTGDGWRWASVPASSLPQPPCSIVALGHKNLTGVPSRLFGHILTTGLAESLRLRANGGAPSKFSMEYNNGSTTLSLSATTQTSGFLGRFLLVGVVDPGGSEIWLNGIREATGTAASAIDYTGTPLGLDLLGQDHPIGTGIAYGMLLNKALTPAEILELNDDPYCWLVRPRRRLADTLVSVSGTIAVTEGADTMAATGGHGVAGTIAVTEGADTASIAAAHGVAGTLPAVEGADTMAASGAHGVAGTIAVTEGADTMVAAGVHGVTGTLTTTEGADTMAGSGTVGVPGVTGTIAAVEGADIMVATGDFAVVGSNAVTVTVRDSGHTSTAREGDMTFDLRYHHLAEEPAAKLWLLDDDWTLIDYSGATTWELQILRRLGTTPLVTKTSGITGTIGSGKEPNGTPNCSIVWATDELSVLTPGVYAATLRARQSGRDRVFLGTFTAF